MALQRTVNLDRVDGPDSCATRPKGRASRTPGPAPLRVAMLLVALGGCMGPAGGDQPQQQRPPPPPPAQPVLAGTPAPAQGWGEHIAWRNLDEGLLLAKAEQRPLMLVVHASWCGQCKKLKPAFQDKELTELTRHFVMVNADQDLVPDVLHYGPDGRYLPRVVFIAPDTGEVDITLTNPRRSKERHFFGPRDDLVGTMRKALARHGKS